ncbi:EpsG family protein [Weissella cibaria]|uniref:EpsG family protein n=1 Tax=Weissella cibaria TaxID=137591 RepID=UPI00215AA0D5|nr:EpsG family protein [Weissella cibaria]MCR8702360.1 EpsG family protein [Weissella cibaria]
MNSLQNSVEYSERGNILEKIYVVVIAIILIVVSGHRICGTDFWTYRAAFNGQDPSSFESGYVYLQNKVFDYNPNFTTMLLVVAAITIGSIAVAILISGTSGYISWFLYFTTFMYFYSFNGIRQSMAMGVFLLGVTLLYKLNGHRIMQVFLVVFLYQYASSFHGSVIMVLPIVIASMIVARFDNVEICKKIFRIGLFLAVFLPPLDVSFIFESPLFSWMTFGYKEYFNESDEFNNRLSVMRLGYAYMKAFVYAVFAYSFIKNYGKYTMFQKQLGYLNLLGYIVVATKMNAPMVSRLLQYVDHVPIIVFPIILMNEKDIKMKKLLFLILIVFGLATITMCFKQNVAGIIPYIAE